MTLELWSIVNGVRQMDGSIVFRDGKLHFSGSGQGWYGYVQDDFGDEMPTSASEFLAWAHRRFQGTYFFTKLTGVS